MKKIDEEIVGLEETTVSLDIVIVDDHEEEWIEDRSKPEVEIEPKETSVTIQDVDRESMKYLKTQNG